MSESKHITNSMNGSSVYHYPLQFKIEARTEVPLPVDPKIIRLMVRSSQRRRTRLRWSPSEIWFLSKIIEDKLNIIDPSSISERIEPLVIKEYERIKDIDDDIFMYIKNLIDVNVSAPSLYLSENILGFFSSDPGLFMIISNSIDEIEPLVTSIKSSASELASITSDLGVTLTGIYSSIDYARNIIESKADSIKVGEYKNDFEKEIHDQIDGNITNSLISNVELTFSASAETHEYDNIICLGRSRLIQVSCKDYSSVKEDAQTDSTTLKNKVIFQPKDKADLIDAECYVILRGFNEQLLREYKAFGSPRDVVILDESEYLEILKKNIIISTIDSLRRARA